jgi:hypothetical protein
MDRLLALLSGRKTAAIWCGLCRCVNLSDGVCARARVCVGVCVCACVCVSVSVSVYVLVSVFVRGAAVPLCVAKSILLYNVCPLFSIAVIYYLLESTPTEARRSRRM